LKYLSILTIAIGLSVFTTPTPGASDTVSTTSTTVVGQSWNPPSLSTAPVIPPSLISGNITTTTVEKVPPLVSPEIMAKWQKVAQCETGNNWHAMGSMYQGALGILVSNWYSFGGFKLFGPLYDATPEQQVFIAIKIQASAGIPDYVPDQYGCGRGW